VINPLSLARARVNSVLINPLLLTAGLRQRSDSRKNGDRGLRGIQRRAITIIMSEALYELMLPRYLAFLRARAQLAASAGAVSL